MPFRGDDADELDGREWPEHEHPDDSDSALDTLPCPFCKTPVYEDAECCPHCGNYLFSDESQTSRKPLWIIIGVVISLLVVLYWIWPG